MRRFLTLFAVVALTVVTMTGIQQVMADEATAPQEMPKDYMKNDKIQREKSPEHKNLAKMVGKWKVTNTMNKMFGGAVSTGTSTMRLILDGKFIISEGESTMMGQKSKTLGIYGYDSLAKEHFALNLNSGYTAAYPMYGKKKADGVIAYTGIMKDAMTPTGRKFRVEEKKHSDDKFEIIIYDGQGDKEFVVMTMMHERVK